MPKPSYVILGTPGFIRQPERFDPETLLRVLGANSGNLMFQYASSQIIDAPLTHAGLSEGGYGNQPALKAAAALVFPAANHLRTGADWTGLNNYLERVKLPLVILGLGAQSPKIGGEAETIAALKADAHVRRLADILRDRAVFISVRGTYSQAVCAELGLDRVQVLGCPSALLHPDPTLGQILQTRLAGLRARLAEGGGAGGDPWQPRLALTAAAPFEIRGDAPKRDLERRLFDWTVAAGGLYVQQSGGVAAMQAANGQWHAIESGTRRSIQAVLAPDMDPVDFWAFLARQGRFYLGAPEWCTAMAGCDLVLGTRLHGTMAALTAGRPGVIISHDSRTGELAETMHLPQLAMEDVRTAETLGQAVARIRFDGAAFDGWRMRTAQAMTAAFDGLGIPVAAQVRRLGTPQAAAPQKGA